MNDQTKWNKKYYERLNNLEVPEPNPRLKHLVSYLSGGMALDLACGLGANSMFLANLNYQVEAVDISEVAITYLQQQAANQNLNINAMVTDLTNEMNWKNDEFDLVVISYYLDRSLFPLVKELVKDNGYFFMETFYQSPRSEGKGVSNRFKLLPKELLREYADWTVLFFEEDEQDGRQTIFCQKS
jgi:tellurite methyltransferase